MKQMSGTSTEIVSVSTRAEIPGFRCRMIQGDATSVNETLASGDKANAWILRI
jgi:hypothetical protein